MNTVKTFVFFMYKYNHLYIKIGLGVRGPDRIVVGFTKPV